MKNKLTDLNNYLFESIERLMDDDLDETQLKKEIARAKAVSNVAENIIENGKLVLESMKFAQESGIGAIGRGEEDVGLPPMLEVGV